VHFCDIHIVDDHRILGNHIALLITKNHKFETECDSNIQIHMSILKLLLSLLSPL